MGMEIHSLNRRSSWALVSGILFVSCLTSNSLLSRILTRNHPQVRFLDIYQVTQALSTVLTNQKQLADMRRSWQSIDFESVRNQSALVCNCRHEELVQLLEVDFVQLLNGLPKSSEPVGEVMIWADNCCERLMGGGPRGSGSGLSGNGEERSTLSSRSILIRWGYVTSQIMRDLVSLSIVSFPLTAGELMAACFFLPSSLFPCCRQFAATRHLALSRS